MYLPCCSVLYLGPGITRTDYTPASCVVCVYVHMSTVLLLMVFICCSYDRMNVLAVFSNTVLVLLAALTVLKHSMERVMSPPTVNTLVNQLCYNAHS